MKILLVFALSLPAMAQLPVSVGLKGGLVYSNLTNGELFALKAGPYLELSLPILPTIETGLMFERYKFGSRTEAVYQVPVLLKKRMNAIAIKPFISLGATFRGIPTINANGGGITIAGGATLGLLPVKIEPEIRFTRWIGDNHGLRQQQAEFLVGFRF